MAGYNAKIKEDFDVLHWALFELPQGTDIFPIFEELEKNTIIEKVEPNGIFRVNLEPDDIYFLDGHQWALKNTGQDPPAGTNDADIDAPEAWDITTGSSDVIIAILDTGIPMLNNLLSHPDLDNTNKIILGPDYIDLPGTPEYQEGVRDRYGHGTHVAGIAGAESNNGIGIAGVAWNCNIMIIQVFDAYGIGT